MAMSRKHYRDAAETVREVVASAGTHVELDAASRIAKGLALMFKRDNSNFRYDTFYSACGLDSYGDVEQS